ncbi:MAG: DUF2231 domain-containing protein [Acidobacteriota bacterium]|nr:DUF2231 domain-containing protein [Acidobacteriota bacterium]
MATARPRPTERGGTVRSFARAKGLLKFGAPLHPIFVHFTIALTASSLAFDALGFFLGVGSLADAGGWTLAGSALMTLMTIVTGLTSAMRAPVEEGEARSFLRAHMALGVTFYGLLIGVASWRMSLWQDGAEVSWPYLAAAGAVSLVMAAQGYLGGELVYRYGVEVEQAYRELPERESKTAPPSLTASPGPKLSTPPRGEGRGGTG